MRIETSLVKPRHASSGWNNANHAGSLDHLLTKLFCRPLLICVQVPASRVLRAGALSASLSHIIGGASPFEGAEATPSRLGSARAAVAVSPTAEIVFGFALQQQRSTAARTTVSDDCSSTVVVGQCAAGSVPAGLRADPVQTWMLSSGGSRRAGDRGRISSSSFRLLLPDAVVAVTPREADAAATAADPEAVTLQCCHWRWEDRPTKAASAGSFRRRRYRPLPLAVMISCRVSSSSGAACRLFRPGSQKYPSPSCLLPVDASPAPPRPHPPPPIQ